MVLAVLGVEAELVVGGLVADDGDEAALGVGGVVEDLGDGRGQAVAGAGAGGAGVPGGAGGVVAEGKLGFAGAEIAAAHGQFGVLVELEAVAGKDVEDAVGAVADGGVVTAALGFELVDVLGIDLGAEVGGDFGVGDVDAVDEPAGLVAAAHVEHVVSHVSGGDEVGDHLHAQGAVGAGGGFDHFAADERGGGYVALGDGGGAGGDGDGFGGRGNGERDVENGVGAGDQGDGLGGVGKAGSLNAEPVAAHGDVGEGEVALGAGGGVEDEGRVEGLEGDGGAGDGAVLGIVDDSANGGEDGGARGNGGGDKCGEGEDGEARMIGSLCCAGAQDGQGGVTVRRVRAPRCGKGWEDWSRLTTVGLETGGTNRSGTSRLAEGRARRECWSGGGLWRTNGRGSGERRRGPVRPAAWARAKTGTGARWPAL